MNPFLSSSVLSGFYFLTFLNDFVWGWLGSSYDKYNIICTFHKNRSLNTGTAGGAESCLAPIIQVCGVERPLVMTTLTDNVALYLIKYSDA